MGVLVGDDWRETVGVNTKQDLMTAENIMRDQDEEYVLTFI